MIEIDSRNRLITLGGVLVITVIVLLVVAFLPPFRLVQRVQGGGYISLSAENPSASHQDGIHVVAVPDDPDSSFGVRLDSVPQLTFLEGSAGAELKRAAEALPSNLLVKSPYYKISFSGEAPDSTIIAVDIPNGAEPWETLDLYTWTGEGWEWVGGRVDAERAMILAEVGANVPEDVVVMQANAISPAILAELPAGQGPGAADISGVTHLLPSGLLLGDKGGISGDVTSLPQPAVGDRFALLPSLRNWSEETGGVNQALLADVLANPGTRQVHIDNIVALVVGQGYAGIDVDYRGVSVDWRDNFNDFVADLATALHMQGKVLSVAVEMPASTADGGWDTGGYDWRTLGQTADVVRVPFPNNAGVDSGDLQSYLAWALSQVGRYKLLATFSALSRDQVGNQVSLIGLDQALAPLGKVSGPEETAVSPGETVRVDLGGEALTTLQRDENSQTYNYSYKDEQGAEHRVTVVTAASLAEMLDVAMRYHLGGVSVAGMLEPGGDPAVLNVVQQFANQAPPAASDALQVLWTVEARSGGQLVHEERPLSGNDSFEWTAPEAAGEYVIGAAIAVGGVQNASRDDVAISVALPTPVATVTPTPSPESTPAPPSDTDRSTVASLSAGCLNSTYVADVTVPDNTRFEKGESFVKTWRVRNSGSCAWPDDTKLVFGGGDALGAPESVNVGALDAGGTTDISVDMVASDTDGNFEGLWRLADSSGKAFGTKLTVVIRVGEEQAVVPVAPAPGGGGGGFELGGHLRTWNYVSQMKYAGMNWAKVQVHYGQDASGLIQTAHANGFKIQLSALGSPGMVTQANFHADYSAWVASLASAGADAIEVWNEPNIDREWQAGQISPAAYTQLLCASYSAIKSANSGALVISAAPAPTGWFGGCSGAGCDDLPWLQGMYNAGAANCMDYIGAHHNSGATSPSARSGHPADGGDGHHSWYFLPQTQLYYNVFGGTRQLFYTEMGYASQEGLDTFSDEFAWARGTNNAQQSAWLAEAVNLSRSTGMVRCIIVWNMDFVRYGYDPQDGYAIIRPGGSCPACDTLHAAMQ